MLRLLSPLGKVKDNPDLVRVSCWRTESVSASKFTSRQRNPSSSPSLSPAVMASMYKASNLSPLAASSNLLASWGESFVLLLHDAWRGYGCAGVARDETVAHSIFQALVENGVDELYGTPRQTGVQLGTVEYLYVRRGYRLELQATQRRDQVYPRDVLVIFPGILLDGVPYRAVEPLFQVLTQRKVAGVKDEPAVPVGHRLGELVADFFTGLTADVAALGAFPRLDPVGSPVADLLPVFLVRIDRAFTVAVLLGHLLLLSLH